MAEISLDPDAPWDAERARRIAKVIGDSVWLLNHGTMPAKNAITDPADLYAIIGDVFTAVVWLPQLLGQLAAVATEHGRTWEHDAGGGAMASVSSMAVALGFAGGDALHMAEHLEIAHEHASHLRVRTGDAADG